MPCTQHRWADAERTTFQCVVHECFVPAVPGNRHYDAIVASGQAILPFGAPMPATSGPEPLGDADPIHSPDYR